MLSNLRIALRTALNRPGFAVAVCGTLALGVAAVTIIFTFVNAILLQSLPYPKADELVQICMYNRGENMQSPLVSIPDVMDWKQQATSFADMAYYRSGGAVLTGIGNPEPITVIRVSEGFFPALNITPYKGRWFSPEEYQFGPDRACIITYQLWKNEYNADPEVVGKQLALNGDSITIVGVMPASFNFPNHARIALTSGFINWEKWHRNLRFYTAIGRLKPGVTLEAAQVQLNGIAKKLAKWFPDTDLGVGVRVLPWKDQIVGKTGTALWVLFCATFCLLVIACINIASLFMVQAIERRKEFAIRVAMGADRFQLASQLVTEGLLLALVGGIISILISFWCVKFLIAWSPARLPRLDAVHINPSVLIFCLGVSVVCGLVFGLVPIIQSFRTNVTQSLNEEGQAGSGSRRTSFGRSAILFFQVTLTVVLMIGAGLLIRSYSKMENVDVGFKPEHVAISKIALRTSQYPSENERNRLFKPLLTRLKQLPGGNDVALAMSPPFTSGQTVTFAVQGAALIPGEQSLARLNSVSEEYFSILGMQIVKGRNFKNTDNPNSPLVVIINQSLAKKYFGSENPIGRHITVQGRGSDNFTIIGIVNDVHQTSFTEDPQPELYFQYLQLNSETVHVLAKVKHSMDLNRIGAGIKHELQSLDNRQAAGQLEPLESIMGQTLEVQKFRTYLLTCFAGVALLLSGIGIFGFLSYTVGQRTREIGILSALGAPRSYIMGIIMKETILIIGVGLLVGLFVAFVSSRLLESFLFGIQAADGVTYLTVLVLVGLVATLATYLPTRKAAKLEVMTALRS